MSGAAISTGVCRVWVWRAGRLVEHDAGRNLVTTAGRDALARLGAGSIDELVADIGFGASATPPNVADVALGSARLWRPVTAVDSPEEAVIRVQWSLPAGILVDGVVSELGLRTPGGELVARRVRSTPVPMASDVSLSGEWLLHIVEA